MILELVWVVPFLILLGAIAVLPLICKEWWEQHYSKVVIFLSSIVLYHYFFQLRLPFEIVHTSFEYFSFISLIGALFVVAGGIHIQVKGEATPLSNCVFLLIAAVSANILGTTGSSMIFIRPWLRMNKYRLTGFHIVFFIILVSNIGGGLTPLGDPPLFLGYLQGVPFFWVMQNTWQIWSLTMVLLIGLFFVLDTINFMRAPEPVRQRETAAGEEWKLLGWHNLFYIGLILMAVFINRPIFLREAIMIGAAFLSYRTTPKSVHESNEFSFGPIREVAILFAGIFATMIPALDWLEKYSVQLGIQTPNHFFWGCGILSSFLDNAPTYLNFLSAATGLFSETTGSVEGGGHAVSSLLLNHPEYVKAISVAAVFFGAVTYIGNGPNLLVKSIADQSKAKTPGFFEYIFKYTLPVLLPVFILISCIYFSK